MSVAPFGIVGQPVGSVTTPASGYGFDVDTGTGIPFVVDSGGLVVMLGGAAPSTTTPSTAVLGNAGAVGTGLTYARADHSHPVTALTDATHGARGGGVSLHPDATGALSGFLTSAQFTKLAALSGTNTGDVTLTAVGASPNVNGATLTGQALNLQPANDTLPGVLTAIAQPIGGIKTFSSQIVGSISGNAGTATVLATPRAINGVNFDGSAPITVTAAAGTLTGATLNATVLASSLTSVGTLAGLTVTALITGSISGNAATVTTNANLTGADVTSVGNATTLVNTGTPGTYGDATHIPVITTDAKGRVTGVTSTTFNAALPGVFLVTANNGGAGASGNNVSDDTAAINRAIAAAVAYTANVGAARGAQVYFPPGIYLCNSALTSPNGDGIVFQGAGRASVTLNINFATGDFLALTSGKANCQVRGMQFNGNVARTSGAFINTNGANDVLVEDFQMTGAFEGIAVTGGSIKVTMENGTINSTVATGSAIRVENGAAGDTYIGPYLVFSNGVKPVAGIRIRQSGHFEIRGCNVTSCQSGLLIDPTAAEDVTYGFISDSLFDSCGVNGLLINPANSATARVRSLKFINSWFAGTVGGTGGAGAFLSTQGAAAIVDDLEFVACRFLNNQTHGLQHAFGTNVRLEGGTVAGNSAASSGVSDGINIAAGITDFTVTGGLRSGPVGTASNTQRWGMFVAAGASDRYTITGNNFIGNVTGGISDGGTGTQKIVTNNLPDVKGTGTLTSLSAPVTTATTVETLMANARIAANAVSVGQTFRITLAGDTKVAGTLQFKVRVGAVGTVAGDAGVPFTGVVSASTAIGANTIFTAYLTVRSLGAPGTVVAVGSAALHPNSIINSATAVATASVTTTAVWFIDVTCTSGGSAGWTAQICTIEAL